MRKLLSIILVTLLLVSNFIINSVSNTTITNTITTITTNAITTTTNTIDVPSIKVTYMTFSGYEKTGYISRDSFVVNKFNYYGTNYDGIDATELVYAEPELINVIGEIYSFGWLWNCEYTIGHITTTTTTTQPVTTTTTTTCTATTTYSIVVDNNLNYAINKEFNNVRYMYLAYVMPDMYLVRKGFTVNGYNMHRTLTTKYEYVSLISIEDLF